MKCYDNSFNSWIHKKDIVKQNELNNQIIRRIILAVILSVTILIIRNTIKIKVIYSSQGIAFNGNILQSFNDFTRDVVIFGVGNSLSFHTNTRKNKFSVLNERPTDSINNNTGASEKKLVLALAKQKQNFAYVDITMVMRVTCM